MPIECTCADEPHVCEPKAMVISCVQHKSRERKVSDYNELRPRPLKESIKPKFPEFSNHTEQTVTIFLHY